MSEIRRLRTAIADLHAAPAPDSMRVTQALLGEAAEVIAEERGWLHLRLATDGYEGFAQASALGPIGKSPTHVLAAIASHIYPAADIKSSPVREIYRGARLVVTRQEGQFVELDDGGFVFAAHLRETGGDPAAMAQEYLGVPYLWGGKSPRGLDCSGLIQIILQARRLTAPRDSGPQAQMLGRALRLDETPARNDLVFWKGHVGILSGADKLIHANAYHMQVVEEDYAEALARIGRPLVVKRLQ